MSSKTEIMPQQPWELGDRVIILVGPHKGEVANIVSYALDYAMYFGRPAWRILYKNEIYIIAEDSLVKSWYQGEDLEDVPSV